MSEIGGENPRPNTIDEASAVKYVFHVCLFYGPDNIGGERHRERSEHY